MESEYIVKIQQGLLKGKLGSNYNNKEFYSFQGIPYAKPPVGALRFKAPLPAEPWEGIKDATTEGNTSLLRDDKNGTILGSEDCLFLNVYTTEINKSTNIELKPVMFWVHGGMYLAGSGNTDFFGPEYLMTEDIILVTINYRLGILGFLNFEDPDLGVPGNSGLKDVVMALKWVQNNIENFCGDPNRVTIAGTSAGASMVHFLVLSPMAKGLFHRAIIQSGCALSTWALNKCNSKEIAKELGCNYEDEKDILHFLSSLPAENFIEAQNKINELFYAHKMRSIGPVIEKISAEEPFLTEHPVDVIKSGNYNKVPLIIGYTSREGIISDLIYGEPHVDFETFDDFQTKIPYSWNIPRNEKFSDEVANKIKKFYYNDSVNNKNNLDTFYMMQTDLLILLGLYNTINLSIKNLNHPIYFYRLSADTSLNLLKNLIGSKSPGACHGDELGYLFKNIFNPPIEKNSVEEICMLRVVKLWANFVRTGNPNKCHSNSLIDVNWQPVECDKYNYLDIGTKLTPGLNLDIERMKIWDEISSINPYDSKF